MRGAEIARASRADVILMDINLPGISGVEALRLLPQDVTTAHMSVIAFSANASSRDFAKGMDPRFFRYLTRPISVADFMETPDVALKVSTPPLGQSKQ